MQRSDLLVWMDLEMTSVQNVLKDQIIEIAVVITDKDLNVIAEGPDIVIHAEPEDFAGISENTRALHEKSGILPLVAQSKVTIAGAEDQVLAFLKEYVAPQTAPLCGNSIHVDRHFLAIHMPRVNEYLFYRTIDVSTVKELAKRWKPSIYEEARSRKGESAHRALDDIKASISELAFYRGAFFS